MTVSSRGHDSISTSSTWLAVPRLVPRSIQRREPGRCRPLLARDIASHGHSSSALNLSYGPDVKALASARSSRARDLRTCSYSSPVPSDTMRSFHLATAWMYSSPYCTTVLLPDRYMERRRLLIDFANSS